MIPGMIELNKYYTSFLRMERKLLLEIWFLIIISTKKNLITQFHPTKYMNIFTGNYSRLMFIVLDSTLLLIQAQYLSESKTHTFISFLLSLRLRHKDLYSIDQSIPKSVPFRLQPRLRYEQTST